MAVKILVLLIILTGCSDDTAFSENSFTSEGPAVDWPEQELTSEGDAHVATGDFESQTQPIVGKQPPSHRVWLNFDGATVTRGNAAVLRTSNLDEVQVAPFAPADLAMDSDRQQIIDRVQDLLTGRFAGINIQLSTEEPDKPYTTVHIGGLNFTPFTGISGISPLDIDNFKNNDVAFVFSAEIADDESEDPVEVLANLIAHEVGHAYGTRHIQNDVAIMNPILDINSNDFDQYGPYPTAEGQGEENSRAVLLTNLERDDNNEAVENETTPIIQSLDVKRVGSVGQYSVFHLANTETNPDANLAKYKYRWFYEGEEVAGTAVRIKFSDEDVHNLILQVSTIDDTVMTEFPFRVGKFKAKE